MIQIRIAFVLRLVDDFTGACIKRKSFRFWTDEKILHPVQKEEGLYVFLEPLEHPARITIEGTDYYPCTVEVDKHILDPEEPIADIRLYGRSGKVYSGGREYRTGVLNIKGQELPAEVYIRRSDWQDLCTRKRKRRISIYHHGKEGNQRISDRTLRTSTRSDQRRRAACEDLPFCNGSGRLICHPCGSRGRAVDRGSNATSL